MGEFGEAAKEAVPALVNLLHDSDLELERRAIEALGRIREPLDVVFPLIVEKLHDRNRDVRQSAAWSLGDLGGKPAFDALMRATDDSDNFVRDAVFQSLEQIDREALEKSGTRRY